MLEYYENAAFIFESVPLVLTLWDENLQIIDCNMEAVRRYGLSGKDEYRQRINELIPPTQPGGYMSMERCFKLLSNVHDGGQLILNVMHYHINGAEIPMEVSFFKTEYKNNPVVLTCATDMRGIYEAMEREQEAAERVLKEQERNAIVEENSKAKSRFLARMSHEIRTPVTAVLGISELLLRREDINAEIEDAMFKIHTAASSLLGIINDILDLSKIESGKMSLICAEYETASLLSDVIQMNLVLHGSKQFKFVAKIAENLPRRLSGDELRIKQVLVNVLSNAFKYTETGNVTFSVDCSRENNKANLLIVISDTGKGMSQEQLSILFTEYTRFHEFEDRFTEGTGLGMPIVYSLLQLMDATIDVKSRVGKGTTVTINIPQHAEYTDIIGPDVAKRLGRFETQIPAGRTAFNPTPMPHGSVLVVDDIETNRYVARGLLGYYQLNVDICNNGLEAIKRIRAGKTYDIIFMDHMMPELNGIETTMILREMGYAKPILALTANALAGMAEEFTSKGFDGFVAKPIQPTELDAALKKFIKPHSGTAPAAELDDSKPDVDDYYSRPDVLLMMREDFVENHGNSAAELRDALGKNDSDTARRIAHTIASLARYMQEADLASAAEEAEKAAKNDCLSSEVLQRFEKELAETLEKVTDPPD
ncbi:MAG: ATP-binding protein [Defluviitaleaceae bacterium]|nr:ATP-binding protein [Defluviitaleaceae bacterium]